MQRKLKYTLLKEAKLKGTQIGWFQLQDILQRENYIKISGHQRWEEEKMNRQSTDESQDCETPLYGSTDPNHHTADTNSKDI